MPAFDLFPLESIDTKMRWLARAAGDNWLCGFAHDPDVAFTTIVRDPEDEVRRGPDC